MKFTLPISLPTGTVFIDGKPGSNQGAIALTLAGHKFAKNNCDVVWCCYSETDGQEHIADAKNWLTEMEVSHLTRKQIELGLHYVHNADSMKPQQLADKIADIAKQGNVIIIRDTSREFGDAQAHWHSFQRDILRTLRCTILHVAKSDPLGNSLVDVSKYQHVYRVAPYRASIYDQENDCVSVSRISEGQQLSPWIFRSVPGTSAVVWKLSDEIPTVAA
jgi:hypothetical protein